MAKRLTKFEKEEILKDFQKGESLEFMSTKFGCTKITIARNIKKVLGEDKYKELKNKYEINPNINNLSKENKNTEENLKDIFLENKYNNIEDLNRKNKNLNDNQFYEIVPIEHNIDENAQKDLSSLPLKSAELPNLVYMIVDKQIELCSKPLREYGNWNFLPEEDLNRLTLEIFTDHKYAKKYCNKNQKLIKIPNPKVFLLASKSLKKKGISRIIFDELLLSL